MSDTPSPEPPERNWAVYSDLSGIVKVDHWTGLLTKLDALERLELRLAAQHAEVSAKLTRARRLLRDERKKSRCLTP